MKIDPSNRIGGGYGRIIQVVTKEGLQPIHARGGLFGGDLYVILDEPFQHQIAIPHWDAMLMRAALDNGEYQPGYHDPAWLVYRVYGSVYEALRYTYHVLDEQYGISFQHGEKRRLSEARNELIELNAIAAGLQKGNADDLVPLFLEKARAILAQIEERPRDEQKRIARQMSIPLASVFDSLGRVNQTVKMTQALAAAQRLTKRMVAIGCIEPVIIRRRQTLKSMIEEMELYWQGLGDYLTRLLDQKYWVQQRPRFMHVMTDRTSRVQTLQHLTLYYQQMEHYDIEPFTKTSYHVYGELSSAVRHIRHEQYGDAQSLLLRIWNSLKLRRFRAELEAALIPFICSMFDGTVDRRAFDDMIFAAKRARRELSSVDEADFRHPVTPRVRGQLSLAIELLLEKTITDGQQAKEHIKAAVRLL